MTDLSFLSDLTATIESRKGQDSDSSYVASLFNKGPAKMAQKLGEEAVEAAIAAAQGDKDELLSESADLMFHLMVLLASQDMTLADVTAKLQARHGTSGHTEKASRNRE